MADDHREGFRWAPRVPQSLIQRLYETDACGIYDDELLDEVGWALYARCDSFITAVEATRGRARCPSCGEIVLHDGAPDAVLRCACCGWQMSWLVYFKSFQHKQLSGADAVLDLFRDFMARFPSAPGPREKMLLIDALIHGFHQDLLGNPTRATGINLIEGRYHEVVAFLDRLTYGEGSTPETHRTLSQWREAIDYTADAWQDGKLKRLRAERAKDDRE